MKDAYSFDQDEQSAKKSYNKMFFLILKPSKEWVKRNSYGG